MIPEIKRGDPITAKYLNQLGDSARRVLRSVGTFGNDDLQLQAPVQGGTTTSGGTTTTAASLKIVLIESSITGVKEYDPQKILTVDDIELTGPEISAGYTVVLQDPPNDDDYDANHVDSFNLEAYKRTKLRLKVYTVDSPQNSGTAQGGSDNTIVLGSDASAVDGFYIGDLITLSNDSSGIVLLYDGATQTATMETDWGTNPTAGVTTYDVITLDDLRLAYVVKDDQTDVSIGDPRKIVQFVFITVYYDDDEDFTVGEYHLDDYPDYPENEAFPPDGSGTYQEEDDSFFNERFRGIVSNNVLVTSMCKRLPPRKLTLLA
jgi:hypothetical protein